MRVNSVPLDIVAAKESVTLPKTTGNRRSESDQKTKSPTARPLIHSDSEVSTSTPVVNGLDIGLEFSVDEETGIRVVKVLNVESGEVVRQIPAEEILAFLRYLDKTKGIFLSRRL